MEQIDYEYLIDVHKTKKNLIDEILFVIVSTICTEFADGYITMGDERVPAENVKSEFFKLEYDHIEYFIDCFNKQTKKIEKKPSYIRKSLYYNRNTITHHATNRAHVDNPYLAEKPKPPDPSQK